MTSRLRRKRPTTAPTSTAPATANSRAALSRWAKRWAIAASLCGALWSCDFFAHDAAAQEFVAPRRFAGEATARPLTAAQPGTTTAASGDWNSRPAAAAPTGSAFERTTESGTLRWRVKQPATAAKNAITIKASGVAAGNASAVTGTANARPSFAERTRLAARQGEAHPLHDPFGDKYPVRRAQAIEPVEDMTPVDGATTSDDSAPMDLNPARREVEPPQPDETPAPPIVPEEEEPMKPMPMAQPQPRRVIAAQQLSCDDLNKHCQKYRDDLNAKTLRNLNDLLDVTAPLRLATDEESAQAQLDRIPPRAWTNRRGEVVAEGKLLGVAYRHVIVRVEDEKGARDVRIPLIEVSDADRCLLFAQWKVPHECQLDYESYKHREFTPSTFTWTASALCHKPLYFEEVQLERYGHTAGVLQPAISGAHFFLNIAILPYRMGINPPNECRYALGYYRPGNCAPWLVPPVPLSLRGAAFEMGAVGAGIPLIP